MTNIFIRESSDPEDIKTILAQKGKVAPDPEKKALLMNLRNGTILQENSTGDTTGKLSFESYVFKYPLQRAGVSDEGPPLEQMSVSEIIAHVARVTAPLDDPTQKPTELLRRIRRFAGILITQRFVHPMAPLVLALLAFPLGVLNMGKSRLNNVSVGLVAIFAYYAVSLACEKVARSGLAPPAFVIPATPLLFTVVAIYFIHCVRLERIPVMIRWFQSAVHAIQRARS
jgi:lipopolysaccharide export LptBFGC system permease protein LptF